MTTHSRSTVVRRRGAKTILGFVLASMLLVLGACSDDPEVVQPTAVPTVVLPTAVMAAEVVATPEDPLQNLVDIIEEVREVQRDLIPLTFNIDLTKDGPKPEHLFVPSNRAVQLVFRNRATSEVHYKVLGLKPDEISWIAVPEDEVIREDDVSEEDHDAHHDRDFVPWREESRSGIQPSGEEIHGYTAMGELDVVRFVSTVLGPFDVVDPLYPEFWAGLTIY